MGNGANNLPAPNRVCPTITVLFHHDGIALIGADHGTKVRHKRSILRSPQRVVDPSKPTTEQALTAALGEVEMLFPPALQIDGPTF